MRIILSTITFFVFLQLHCLQGPWEYTAEVRPVFRGLTVNAYIVSGRPVTEFCVERLRTLNETFTSAFPFYNDATVTISGNGGKGTTTITLTPKPDCPNCFTGPDDFTGQPGESYTLFARFTWDSAGSSVVSTITAAAHIPERWRCGKIARVNGAAISLPDTASMPSNPLVGSLFGNLPPSVLQTLTTLYLPEVGSMNGDTAALVNFFMNNRERIQNSIDSLLSEETLLVPYNYGDTVTYLTGPLNLLSHYFSIDCSDDVAGMLITHSFDTNSITAENSFDQIASTFGPLDPSYFYLPGTEYRLQFYNRIEDNTGDKPVRLFDMVPIVNLYLKGGKNTFYFYGTDSCYANFTLTYILQHSSPDVIPQHPVKGAEGYFAGMSLDSFVVYATIPPGVKAFTTFEARADYCKEREWNRKDCRCFEPSYCAEVNYNEMQYAFDHPDIISQPEERSDCLAEAVAHYLSQGKTITHVEDSILTGGTSVRFNIRNNDGTVAQRQKTFTEEELSAARNEGLLRYCIRDDFGDSICSDIEAACKSGTDTAAQVLYSYCEDNNWQPSPCKWAATLYCRHKSNPPKELCDKGNTWCREHPDDGLCR